MSTTKYLPASFGGAAFLVEASSDEGGARHVLHEFPSRKYAYAESNGEYPQRFSIEAHVIGENFESDLAALETALRKSGPDKLVHPHRGTLLVAVESPYRISRTTRELGMARISISFCEVGPAQEPRVTPDTRSEVRANVAIAYTHVSEQRINLKGPDFLTAAVRSILVGPRGVTSALSRVNNRINAAFGLVDEVSRSIDEFSNEVTTLLLAPDTLGLKLQNLANSVLSAITAAENVLSRGDTKRNASRVDAVAGYLSALGTFGDGLPTVATPTATREQERANQDAMVDMVEASAVIGTVEVLADLPLDNADQAADVYDALLAVFNRIEDRGTLNDAAVQALRDVRAAYHRHLRSEVGDLPELGRYTPPLAVSAMALSVRLYGNSGRDQEIIDRNPSIEHPGFIQGGVELSIAER